MAASAKTPSAVPGIRSIGRPTCRKQICMEIYRYDVETVCPFFFWK